MSFEHMTQLSEANLDAKRRGIIEKVFEDYDFEPNVVKEANGWQHDKPDEYCRVIFFDNGDQPSRWAMFSVTFRAGSTEVAHAGT